MVKDKPTLFGIWLRVNPGSLLLASVCCVLMMQKRVPWFGRLNQWTQVGARI